MYANVCIYTYMTHRYLYMNMSLPTHVHSLNSLIKQYIVGDKDLKMLRQGYMTQRQNQRRNGTASTRVLFQV